MPCHKGKKKRRKGSSDLSMFIFLIILTSVIYVFFSWGGVGRDDATLGPITVEGGTIEIVPGTSVTGTPQGPIPVSEFDVWWPWVFILGLMASMGAWIGVRTLTGAG